MVSTQNPVSLPPDSEPQPDILLLKPRPSPLKRPPTRRVVGVAAPSCTWPQGHPGEPGFHFCGKRPVQGKPYCTEHAAMAYVAPKKHNAA